jgi:O-methyltransferase involved in polyketide biosynthesis
MLAEVPGPLSRYLAAHTSFFDKAVVRWLDGGGQQVVVAAAGYDARSLRYAKNGVRWFELDHAATQRDKRSRLSAGSGCFGRLVCRGGLHHRRCRRRDLTMVLCEGIAVYLEPKVLESLLSALRSASAPRSQLAISLSIDSPTAETAERRQKFQASVAALGEPAHNSLTIDAAIPLLKAAGWRPRSAPATDATERAKLVGFVVFEASVS